MAIKFLADFLPINYSAPVNSVEEDANWTTKMITQNFMVAAVGGVATSKLKLFDEVECP